MVRQGTKNAGQSPYSPQGDCAGQAVIFVMILLASGLIISVAVFGIVGQHILLTGIETDQERAVQLAEAGVNRAVFELNQNTGWNGVGETTLGNGSYEIIVSGSGSSRTVEAFGYYPNKTSAKMKRKVRVVITSSPGADSFKYGVQSGTGGLEMNSEAKVNGSVYSNGNINCYSNSRILGDGFSAGTITPSNCPTGQSVSGASSRPLPYFDRDYWIEAAEAGGTLEGSQTYSSGTVTLGPKRINGNITINAAKVIVTGPIYATGTLEMNSGSILKLDDSFGTEGTVVLVDGRIALNSNSKVERSESTAILRPNGDMIATWSVTPSGNHWSALDDNVEQPASGDTSDRISSATNGQTDEFDLTTVTGVTTTREVVIWAYARNGDPSNGDRLGINLVVNDSPLTEQSFDLTTSYAWVQAVFAFDPPLTKNQLDGLRVRVREIRSGQQDRVDVAALYARVVYTAENAGYLMLVSDRATSTAIELNSEAKGGTFYARFGILQVNANSHPVSLAGHKIYLNSNAQIFYDSGLPDQSFSSGPGGGWGLRRGTWRVMMP